MLYSANEVNELQLGSDGQEPVEFWTDVGAPLGWSINNSCTKPTIDGTRRPCISIVDLIGTAATRASEIASIRGCPQSTTSPGLDCFLHSDRLPVPSSPRLQGGARPDPGPSTLRAGRRGVVGSARNRGPIDPRAPGTLMHAHAELKPATPAQRPPWSRPALPRTIVSPQRASAPARDCFGERLSEYRCRLAGLRHFLYGSRFRWL